MDSSTPVLVGVATSLRGEEQRLRSAYVEAVVRAGGVPVLLPIVEEPSLILALAERLDALLVPGGPGIVRNVVGTLPSDLDPVAPARAIFDEAMTTSFLTAEKPVLGVCYGMQLLNVLGGGSLYADVERQRDGAMTHSAERGGPDHPIRIEPGSRLHAALGATEHVVNSRHVQAIAELAPGLRATAWAPDGVIEAIESADGLRVGVQFHPERMGDGMAPLFRALVERARAKKRAAARPPPP